jgi:hypothetical protein
MIDFGPIDELREARRRLAAESDYDIHRYAEMLRAMGANSTVTYVTQPLLPDAPPSVAGDSRTEATAPTTPPRTPVPNCVA